MLTFCSSKHGSTYGTTAASLISGCVMRRASSSAGANRPCRWCSSWTPGHSDNLQITGTITGMKWLHSEFQTFMCTCSLV
ncbi:Os06g0656400 [Oryza sativa Japonica Group]|uniref:Os06g0656400 protein n=2 Tax=Oryza sativa subsp. japonica TaxID=39947 RepID=B9FQA7_ORYSJ|nr:hypothetical protein OsJ_22217 [Oryza sativa Japonica Group]KAB8103374.1 hypothetical protein EE612_035783 [Oryza sativa]BAF20167.1 Os06g0656400 [Oryza sativa Japonica Group]BAS98943.1 Os06g0656400 [Oryza sativa Japonica Group]|eukprot:NP_001058253.1 Os06g0656400 [Oryza sativa Japonica Group]